jgi:type I restriction enzyme S subunit
MKWEKVKLVNKTSYLKRGVSPKYVEGTGYTIINQKCIRDNRIDFTFKKICDSQKTIPEEKILKKGDILINSTGKGTLGRTAQIKNDLEEKLLVDTHITIVRAAEDVDPFFLGQLIRKNEIVIEAMGKGSTQQLELSRTDLGELELSFPPLPTQRKIASILSAYDDLIENNLKRIKLLEERARIEFKSIQKNEKIEFKKAVEVLQFSTGKLNSNAAVQNGQYPFFTCGQEILRTNTFSIDEEVVLLGGNNASAIYPVFYYKGKFDAYQRTYIIKPKPEFYISFKYLYFFWEGKLDYLKNISTGAATKFLTLKILNDIYLPLPGKRVMEEYEVLTEPIFELKAILAEQNTKLRQARDILLPRLMNRQIEV